MKRLLSYLAVAGLSMGVTGATVLAQTDGSVELNASIHDMSGNGDDHWTAVWVTKADGTFIKTIWKQGPSITSSKWNDHCKKYYAARNNTVLDGYSTATARNYSSPNSPIIQSWDCRDANGTLMPDGNYKFWIQYAEDGSHSSDGPVTTAGLLWTKGTTPSTTTYANQGSNFSNMSVVWSPVYVPPPSAEITAVNIQGSAIIITGTGTISAAYTVVCTTNLSESVELWPIIESGTIDGSGNFSNSIPIESGSPSCFYRIKLP